MGKKIIEFKNVKKDYNTGSVPVSILKGVNFSIDEGEFVIILGASGAGKSTVLNILGGMDNPTSGSVIVDGEDISKYKENKLSDYRKNKIGFVFQFYNLIPNLTVQENVEFGSEGCSNTLNSKEILEKVGLNEKLSKFPATLSGGEQQRVAIARAVTKNPLLLLCDEPTGALDYNTSKAVLTLLQNLNKEMKKTIVLITHNSAIAPMADKVITIRSGLVKDVKINNEKVSVTELEW